MKRLLNPLTKSSRAKGKMNVVRAILESYNGRFFPKIYGNGNLDGMCPEVTLWEALGLCTFVSQHGRVPQMEEGIEIPTIHESMRLALSGHISMLEMITHQEPQEGQHHIINFSNNFLKTKYLRCKLSNRFRKSKQQILLWEKLSWIPFRSSISAPSIRRFPTFLPMNTPPINQALTSPALRSAFPQTIKIHQKFPTFLPIQNGSHPSLLLQRRS